MCRVQRALHGPEPSRRADLFRCLLPPPPPPPPCLRTLGGVLMPFLPYSLYGPLARNLRLECMADWALLFNYLARREYLGDGNGC